MKRTIWTVMLCLVLFGFHNLNVYADEIVVNKKGEPVLLKDDGTWEVMSTKGEDGKVVFSIRKGTDHTFSVARKNDMDEFTHYDTYAGCVYNIEVKNKTKHKTKINIFKIATNNSKLIPNRMDRTSLLQFGKVIEPGNSFIGKGMYKVGKISTKAGKTKQTPKDDKIKLWKSQYGCEAQSGSIFIKPSGMGKDIAFSKESGVSDDAKSSFLIGSSKGMYPLMKEIKLQ